MVNFKSYPLRVNLLIISGRNEVSVPAVMAYFTYS